MDMSPGAGTSSDQRYWDHSPPPIDERYWAMAAKLAAHEAMCEERSRGIFDRLEKIETGIEKINHWGVFIGFTLICGMCGLTATLLLK